MSEPPFLKDLGRELAHDRYNDYSDNFDFRQLGKEPPPPPTMWQRTLDELEHNFIALFDRLGNAPFIRPILRLFRFHCMPQSFFKEDTKRFKNFSYLYTLLGNQSSRDLLVKLCAYRILGHRKVRLTRNTPQYWQDIELIEQYKTPAAPIKIKFMDAALTQYDFKPLGYDFKVYATPPGSACALVQKQYEYHQGDVHCKAEAGDVVIDAGGCWGETTIYFAHEVGPAGKVISFEFIPSNLEVMMENIRANPGLGPRIAVVGNPLWNRGGLKLYFVDWGPGSRITDDPKKYNYHGTCETTTIDDIVTKSGLPRVDFIKMDIEGAELPALLGAERIIRKCRPKLAISLYHQLSDFVTIPKWLNDLNLGYDFYLDHHTIYQNETVLFAIPSKDFTMNPTPAHGREAA